MKNHGNSSRSGHGNSHNSVITAFLGTPTLGRRSPVEWPPCGELWEMRKLDSSLDPWLTCALIDSFRTSFRISTLLSILDAVNTTLMARFYVMLSYMMKDDVVRANFVHFLPGRPCIRITIKEILLNWHTIVMLGNKHILGWASLSITS